MKKYIGGKYVTVEPKAPKKITLEAAVKKLDPAVDAHWTKKGNPDLTALTEIMGRVVTRAEVSDAVGVYNREYAAGLKA